MYAVSVLSSTATTEALRGILSTGPSSPTYCPGPSLSELLLAAIGKRPVHLEPARLDRVDELTAIALLEQNLSGSEMDRFGWFVGVGEAGSKLHDPVSELGDPIVMGSHDDQPTGRRQTPQQREDPLDLDVVEMCGRFVSHHQRWVVHQRPGDRHPLLLAS